MLKRQNLLYITLGLLILIFSLMIFKNYSKNLELKKEEKKKQELVKNFDLSNEIKEFLNQNNLENQLIAHAGGGINELTYTNSLEALNQSISNGFKLIELDLKQTSDEKLVAVHDWKSFKRKTNCCDNLKFPIDHKTFNDQKISNLNLLDYKKINEIFSENKDLILITDKSNNFELINNQLNFDASRIIVEIFGQQNYFKAIQSGIKNPMYSANLNDFDFIKKYNVKLIAIHTSELQNHYEKYLELKNNGVLIFVYSSNEINFIKKYQSVATAFYTDFLSPASPICKVSNCKTY